MVDTEENYVTPFIALAVGGIISVILSIIIVIIIRRRKQSLVSISEVTITTQL